jgi:hypothetical protein
MRTRINVAKGEKEVVWPWLSAVWLLARCFRIEDLRMRGGGKRAITNREGKAEAEVNSGDPGGAIRAPETAEANRRR